MTTTTEIKAAPQEENLNVTKEQYEALQASFDYYNKELFANKLPRIMLTFSRRSRALGFFVPSQWHTEDEKINTHEISMNPDYMQERTFEAFYSTLVHEMCHLLQEVTGEAPRRCYHNKAFASVMESIGLMTSSTGKPGGKRTGQNMTHYIIEDGLYKKAFDAMPAKCRVPFIANGLLGNKKVKKSKRASVKYVCPICEAELRGKDGINVKCCDCNEFMLPVHK